MHIQESLGIDNHSHLHSDMHMIICVCRAVSESRIRDAVNRGARSLMPVVRELGVGDALPFPKLNERTLTKGLERLLDPGVAARARALDA